MRLLVVVDMQEDFIRGALTVPGAEEIISPIEKLVKEYITADDAVLFTRDTHYEHSDTRGFSYAMTREGRNLPILHCVCGTEGHKLIKEFKPYLRSCYVMDKLNRFGFIQNEFNDAKIDDGEYLFDIADCITEITLVGVVTNLCVISCAVSFQQIFPDADIIIDASCCRSNNNELHNKALDVMEGLQMTIINRY